MEEREERRHAAPATQLGSKQRAIAMLGFISKPTILSFAINDAAPSTSQRTVRLTSIDIYDPSTNTCVVSPTRLPVADAVAACGGWTA
jgi:hypothetical protein